MAAPIGNQYWKLAKNFKKPKSYQPEELIDKAIEYAKWCDENPLQEEKAFANGTTKVVSKMRVMTIQGFRVYAGIVRATFYNYEKQEEYLDIITRIRDIFESQSKEGAAGGLLDTNIIARLLGLAEKKSIDLNDNRKSVDDLFPKDDEIEDTKDGGI